MALRKTSKASAREKLLGELLRLECSSSKEHPAGMSMEVSN